MSAHTGLITTAELAGMLGQPELRLFDCTTYLEPAPEDSGVPYLAVPGRHTFEAGHIPGATFSICRANSPAKAPNFAS